MSTGTITLSEAMDIIKRRDGDGNKVPFSIEFTTLNNSRKEEPSKHVRIEDAVECGARHNLVAHMQVGVKRADGTGHQYPVHIDLIERINGKAVA
jgi:hypothetical protein